jgi:preprotein translocase subunit SecY
MITTITAGTMLLMWIGEIITEKGIGNGISLIIFCGIISRLPRSRRAVRHPCQRRRRQDYPAPRLPARDIAYHRLRRDLLNEGTRNIPVSYAKRPAATASTPASIRTCRCALSPPA